MFQFCTEMVNMGLVLMNVVRHICFMEKHYWNLQGNLTHNFSVNKAVV